MSFYLLLKLMHIVSSVLLAGVGFGSAYYLYFIHRTGNPQAIAKVIHLVVRADFWFTTPAIIIQPLTGLSMIKLAGYPLGQAWLIWTGVLYLLAGACWIPVVWLQLRMSKIAANVVDANSSLPTRYWQYARCWEWLAYPAFVSVLIIYGLMVFKPGF